MSRAKAAEALSALAMLLFVAGFPIAMFMIGTSR